jgi:Glycosyltransferase family 87
VTVRQQRWRSALVRAGEWALPLVLGAYILNATVDWEVPQPGGVRFGPLWLAVTILAGLAWLVSGRRMTPVAIMALSSVSGMVLTDITSIVGQNLRDLHLYVHAGDHFITGQHVYLDRLFTVRPADLSNYPFLYPPMTLPVFAVLARLPALVVDAGWLALSIAASVATLRIFGVRGPLLVVFLVWPPFFQGIQVGNVVVFAGLLFAIAPRWGAGLVVAAIFKLYSGIAALWLVRQGRLRELLLGVAIILGLALVTLPLTGIDRWREWLVGLDWFRASQPYLPGSLYGIGLARFLPFVVFVVIAAAVVGIALRSRGLESLRRLGVATIVASPSLYAHGLIVMVPALLRLNATWLWLALGITSVAPGIGWWAGIVLIVASWLVPPMRRPEAETPIWAVDDRPPGGVASPNER